MKKTKPLLSNKKFVLSAVVMLIAAAAVIVYLFLNPKIKATDTISLKEISNARDVTLVGHRGLSSQAPENTLAAFELAAEKGLKTVEFDIYPTKDDVWVVSHDESLKRMTDGNGSISDYTFFDIADFTIDNGANIKKYDNLKMPSLDDALDCCLENSLEPMIEIKDYTDKSIQRLADSIISHGFEKSCRVISFDYEALEAVRSADPEIRLAYLVSEFDDEHFNKCFEHPDIGVSFKADKRHNNAEKISKLLSNDIELFCWVVDSKKDFDFYYNAGVSNFVTNRIIP